MFYMAVAATLCNWGTFFTLVILYPWATFLSVSFLLSPLRTSEWSFSLCTSCSLLSPTGLQRPDSCFHTIVFLLFIYRLILNFCATIMSLAIYLSICHSHFFPGWLTYIAALTLNSTPCCPPAHRFPPSQSLLSFPPLPPVVISSLQGEPQWDWEAKAEQDDRVHHRIVGHGAHLQCTSKKARQINNPANGCVPYEVSKGKWQHQLGRVVQTLLSHWPGMSNRVWEMWKIVKILTCLRHRGQRFWTSCYCLLKSAKSFSINGFHRHHVFCMKSVQVKVSPSLRLRVSFVTQYLQGTHCFHQLSLTSNP